MGSTRISSYNKQNLVDKEPLNKGELTNAAVSYYSPNDNEEVEITSVKITNTTNQARWFTLWVDPAGITYDDTTVEYYEIDVEPNSTMEIDAPIYMNGSGNLAMEAEQNSVLTFAIYGEIRRLK